MTCIMMVGQGCSYNYWIAYLFITWPYNRFLTLTGAVTTHRPTTNPTMRRISRTDKQNNQPLSPQNSTHRQLLQSSNINHGDTSIDDSNPNKNEGGMNQSEEEEEMMETVRVQSSPNVPGYNQIQRQYEQRLAMNIGQQVHRNRMQIEYSRIMDNSYILPPAPQKLDIRVLNAMDGTLPVFSPESYVLLAWNFLMLFVVVFQFLQAPVAIFLTASVYEAETNTGIGLAINGICLILLYIDTFLVRLSIAYYHKGKLIRNRVSIYHNYMIPQLILNIISLIALTIYISSHNYQLVYIKLLFYCRVYNLRMIDKQITHALEFMAIPYGIYRLGRLVVMLWFITSLAATVFFAIDYHYYVQQGEYYHNGWLWLTNSEAVGNLDIINNCDWFVWYSYALYWAIQTASTVGYGDLTPMNPVQVIYVVIIILLMTILFAFYINKIWRILEDFQNNSIEFTPMWYQYKKYMRNNRDLTKQLKQRISNCLYQLWQDKINEQIQSDIISTKISKELQDAFYVQYKSVFYSNINLFKALSCSTITIKDIMKELVDIIEFHNVSEGINVYTEGVYDHYLYYLRKGQVKLTISASALGGLVEDGSSFGVDEFFRGIARNHTALAQSFTKMWRISFQNLRKVLHHHPYLNQSYCQLLYRIIIEKSTLYLNLQCWKCKNKYHFLSQCPQLNSWRDKLAVNKNNISSVRFQYFTPMTAGNHERKYYVRSKVKSICNKNVIKAIQFREDLSKLEHVDHFRYFFPDFNFST